MTRQDKLYREICEMTERESLSDVEIHKIALFLQRRLGQPGDTADLSVGELVHVNSDSL